MKKISKNCRAACAREYSYFVPRSGLGQVSSTGKLMVLQLSVLRCTSHASGKEACKNPSAGSKEKENCAKNELGLIKGCLGASLRNKVK